MSAIRRIFAPAPSAEVAASAARAAVRIARAFSAEVEGVHITHVPMEPVVAAGGVGAPFAHEYYAALEEAGVGHQDVEVVAQRLSKRTFASSGLAQPLSLQIRDGRDEPFT